eukprot:5151964-Heterocapsa_arctica.AAC.1
MRTPGGTWSTTAAAFFDTASAWDSARIRRPRNNDPPLYRGINTWHRFCFPLVSAAQYLGTQ